MPKAARLKVAKRQGSQVNAAGDERSPDPAYVLDEQVGFLLRQVNQRHVVLFAQRVGQDITPMQWAALAKLHEKGPLSQNLLGRLTAMDVATVKGVVDRLTKRGLTEVRPDCTDGRRLLVGLSSKGRRLVQVLSPLALAVSDDTLALLTSAERTQFLRLLKKLC